jgi:mono/diheme cytochrome c family protein
MSVSKNRKKTHSNDSPAMIKGPKGVRWAWYLLAGILVMIGIGLVKLTTGSPDTARLNVTVPKLEGAAVGGEKVFAENCAVCHGKNAAGSDKGPPLVHKIYEPSHHADSSIYMAAKRGVRAHHWPFGNMPPVPAVTDQQIATIITYIRTLQRANGIGNTHSLN